jgi:hypothetical protein
MTHDASETSVGRLESALVLCLGLAAVGYGVARSVGLLSDSLPGPVYVLAGALLAGWGLSIYLRG